MKRQAEMERRVEEGLRRAKLRLREYTSDSKYPGKRCLKVEDAVGLTPSGVTLEAGGILRRAYG